MHYIKLSCSSVPKEEGAAAANDITQEFLEDRTWHNHGLCSWDGESLILEAYNDYNSDGLALMDEFSDCISAYVKEHFEGEISLVFVRACR